MYRHFLCHYSLLVLVDKKLTLSLPAFESYHVT